ncbi:MAG: VPLPA-CTERM sorting domain-containing protein [Rhodobacteraceae bacterium]|nr:VPLPA-CTERM sorting domain-containing protein [Paracoccaceae bacterium]
MMKAGFLAALAAATVLSASDGQAATYDFAGSWMVEDGPFWADQPLAYTGQEAAALLFGGAPGDYVISTIDALVANINFKAWYSILGVPGGFELAQDLDQALPSGLYYDGASFIRGLMTNPASSFVWDNAQGVEYTNYAFRVSEVPLPAAGFLLIGALGGLVLLRRRGAMA